MALSEEPAKRHAQVAGLFGELVVGTQNWSAPSPVAGWSARHVVGHLCSWFPAFLATGTAIELNNPYSVETDPVAAWGAQAGAVQRLLEERADAPFSHPQIGDMPLGQAITQFYTSDVFMHSWDLAKATGQAIALDEDECRSMFAGMEPIEEMLRSSGHYGTGRGALPESTSAQDLLMSFIGRDATWTP